MTEAEIKVEEDDNEEVIIEADAKDDQTTEDEIDEYSESVQKRINELTAKLREAEREKQTASSTAEEAMRYAERMKAEAERNRKIVEEGSAILYEQTGTRIDAQIEAVKREYSEAFESGDPDKLVNATEKLAALQAEKAAIEGSQQKKQLNFSPAPQQPQQQVQQPQQPVVGQRDKEWAAANPWFGSDNGMTGYAYGLHDDLTQRGVQPGSEEYYRQIDEAMRKRFPEKFDSGDVEQPKSGRASVVAPPSRTAGRKTRKVSLTRAQLNLCERLNISPEKYAQQLEKEALK